MENLTPQGSQENLPLSTAVSTDGGEPISSPIPSLPRNHNGSKQRKPPTITPRSFTRFFTPKSSLERGGRIGASRRALRDITAQASNRRGRRTPTKDTIQIYDENLKETSGVTTRKRKTPNPIDDASDRSSPLKRIRNQSLDLSDEDRDADQPDSGDEIQSILQRNERPRRRILKIVDPILGSKYRSGLGRDLRREIGAYGRITKPRSLGQSLGGPREWQHETAVFHTGPEDIHVCHNVTMPSDHSIPFCTASCNTNSLVAIGDEDGGVRLLESAKDEEPEFSKAYLKFRPHTNAVLDLAFSADDLLLATASGDQSSLVIDMPTQRATYTLAGHGSSVKQVCFQPGSPHVLATSSRDGTVQIWDLRCKGFDAPVRAIKVPLEPSADCPHGSQTNTKMNWARPVNTISEAHRRPLKEQIAATGLSLPSHFDPPHNGERLGPDRWGVVSITALHFLNPGREHLLVTASEADASVKLWDLRTTHNHRRGKATPLSSTRPTGAHTKHRHFGVTSLSLSGDSARLYTVCRDNTIYAYSTSHLVLGHSPELSGITSKPRRSGAPEREGLPPIYGFRHPKFHASTFYVKSTLRLARDDKTELLAVGSSDGCAVVFPTDERYMQRSNDCRMRPSDPFGWKWPATARTNKGTGADFTVRLEDSIPIYQHGSALIRGHNREVTGMRWTTNGNLVSVSDDYTVRCWREDGDGKARDLRMGGEREGRRWGCGWAEADEEWDGDDG